MKTTILIKENRTQLVLSPETEHDKDALKVLEKLPNTYRADLYDTEGGWTQFSPYKDKRQDLMIVFETATDPASEPQTPKGVSKPTSNLTNQKKRGNRI